MDDQGESDNVQDVRGSSGGFRPIHGIGIGSVVLACIAGLIFHVNPLTLLGLMSSDQPAPTNSPQQPAQSSAPLDPQARFVSQVLKSTETVWTDVFRERGLTYSDPKLRLFRDSYPTACGQGSAAAGPFYCGEDRVVYLDLGFFDVMTQQLGATGQFAHAYVIGHEVGHHVQNLLGTLGKINAQRERSNAAQANALSVRLELQADCFAGVWAARSQKERGWRLEPGDIESALNAASRIGDDTLQRQSRGTVVPETFTHGTSVQRVSWFKRGLSSGQIEGCDTFGPAPL
jgi:predicted metalloprotease